LDPYPVPFCREATKRSPDAGRERSEDLAVRETARVAIFSIEAGKRAYWNRNAW